MAVSTSCFGNVLGAFLDGSIFVSPDPQPRNTATVLRYEAFFDDVGRSTVHVGRASHVMLQWSTFGQSVPEVDRRRRKIEHSIADRYFCNPSGIRRPYSEHSIADRYFCNPSGAPKSAGGRPGEAFGANPREGWLRRVAGEGAPGRPGEALGG